MLLQVGFDVLALRTETPPGGCAAGRNDLAAFATSRPFTWAVFDRVRLRGFAYYRRARPCESYLRGDVCAATASTHTIWRPVVSAMAPMRRCEARQGAGRAFTKAVHRLFGKDVPA